jgi:hypothetical protein
MKKWEVKYRTPNAGASQPQVYAIEATNKREAMDKFISIYPLEVIESVEEVVP